MFKTNHLTGRCIYETSKLACIEVRTKFDSLFVTQIFVSLADYTPYFDENWIDKTIETTVIHLSHEEVKNEILEGVQQYADIRKKIP